MSNNQLANVNEIAFTIACSSTTFDYDVQPAGGNLQFLPLANVPHVNSDHITALVGAVEVIKNTGNNLKKVIIKIEQAKQGAAQFKEWLFDGVGRQPNLPSAFMKQPFWNESLEIVPELVGWTDTKAKFEGFLTAAKSAGAKKLCGGDIDIVHNDNPSDTLVVVKNANDEKRVLGISLKATFSTGELTIFNGGVCATLACVIQGQDVSQKKKLCSSSAENKTGTNKALWEEVDECTKSYTNFVSGNGITSKDEWETLKKSDPTAERAKLASLSGIRDTLFKKFAANIVGGVVTDAIKNVNSMIPRVQALNIVGGILQFTHENIQDGVCSTPYVKLTGFLNTKKSGAYLSGLPSGDTSAIITAIQDNLFSQICPPDLSEFIPDGQPGIPINIEKAGAVSIKLTIGPNPPVAFNVRVKLESRPPSNVKIDICPVKIKTGKKKASKKKKGGTSVDLVGQRGGGIEDYITPVGQEVDYIASHFGLSEDNTIQFQNIWQNLTCEKPPIGSEDIMDEPEDAEQHIECPLDSTDVDVRSVICQEISKRVEELYVDGRAITKSYFKAIKEELTSLLNLWRALGCENATTQTYFDSFVELLAPQGGRGNKKKRRSRKRRRSSKKKTRSKKRVNKKKTRVKRRKGSKKTKRR
jgi:hypothetical protein